jgi:hypothetical protein
MQDVYFDILECDKSGQSRGRLKVFLMALSPVLIRPRRGFGVFWGHDESDQPRAVFLQLPSGGMGGLFGRAGRRPLSPA